MKKREIKFRRWNGVEMYYPHLNDMDDTTLDYLIDDNQNWMQFTGLKDKNGKEIYEEDIVKCLLATEPEDKGFICKFKDYRWEFNNVHYPDDVLMER
jgi:uncharacterized phage protein (TIGR01671 family)